MPGFTPKNWVDSPSTTTPISAAALEDLETRVTDYAEIASGTVYNVVNYGAVGDGSADDTAEVQAAIDDAKTNGGTVFFPPGTYKITSTLSCDSNTKAFRITGAGGWYQVNIGTPTLLYTPATGSLFTF